MKKRKKILLWPVILSPVLLAPTILVSCSKNYNNGFSSVDSINDYENLWNTSLTTLADDEDILKNSIYSMSVAELNQKINNTINSNKKTKKIIKILSFTLLWESIKNPYTKNGEKVTILSEELKNYNTFLTNKLKPDPSSDVDDKKYKQFDKFIESFYDVRIEVIAFNNKNDELILDDKQKIGDLINSSQNLETLNFQFSFKIKDEEANTLILNKNDKNKHIFYKTTTDREERQIIKEYANNKDEQINSMIINQFNYQGSKMYYDVKTQTFKSIVLTSNIKFGGKQNTNPSGFINDYDTKRTMFYIDFKKIGSKKYEQYLILDLSNSAYFDVNLSTDFNNYLKKEKFINSNNEMKKIEFRLNKVVIYEPEKETEQELEEPLIEENNE